MRTSKLFLIGTLLIELLGFGRRMVLGVDVGNEDPRFDFLIFAQIWPKTDCILWRDRSESNYCILQAKPAWTIHGIWPSKNKTLGPFHCKDSKPFDKDVLKPILPELTLNWLDIRDDKDTYGFWKHEWEKHGTCAGSIPALDSELKYFKQALKWHTQFPLIMILAKAAVLPGSHFSAYDFINPVKKFLNGTQPGLECAYDHKYQRYLISQINICYDKKFNIINCTEEYGGLIRNCPMHKDHKQIFYPEDSGYNPGPPPFNLFGIVCGIIITFTVVVLFISWVVDKIKEKIASRSYERI